jgi:hypothetical protein
MPQDKIVSIQGNGTWNSQHGMLYSFEYSLLAGAVVSANHKTPASPFKVGDVVEYEIKGTKKDGRSWGSVRKPQDQAPNSDQTSNSTPSKQGSRDNVGNIIDASWAIGHALTLKPYDLSDAASREKLKLASISLIHLRNSIVERIEKYGWPSEYEVAAVDDTPQSEQETSEVKPYFRHVPPSVTDNSDTPF